MGELSKYFSCCCLCFVVLSCQNPEIQKVYNYKSHDTLTLVDSNDQIIIAVKDRPVNFKLKINNRFPLTIDNMLEKIEDIVEQKNISKEQAAWEFVSKSTFHSKTFTEQNWQNTPETFINSIGGGLCGSRAAILADLWSKMDFDSRLINLVDYHIVSEVFSDGKWKMFDADKSIYYFNEKKEIASVDELRETPSLVSSPNGIYDFKNQYTFHNLWTEKLAHVYKIATLSTVTTKPDEPLNQEFSLPANSSLVFYSANSKNISSLVVELSEKSIGSLALPFVPFLAVGSLKFEINDSVYILTNDTLWFNNDKLIQDIQIVEVDNTARIMYLVNPYLNVLSSKNFIAVESSGELRVNTSNYNDGSLRKLIPNNFAIERLMLDSLLHLVYLDFMIKSKPYYSGNIDNYLLSEFQVFLALDTTLSKFEKEQFLQIFPEKIRLNFSDMNTTPLKFIELSNKYHPMSLYYLFSSVRYNKSGFMLQTWNETKYD